MPAQNREKQKHGEAAQSSQSSQACGSTDMWAPDYRTMDTRTHQDVDMHVVVGFELQGLALVTRAQYHLKFIPSPGSQILVQILEIHQ
jgi:hypothetical protein